MAKSNPKESKAKLFIQDDKNKPEVTTQHAMPQDYFSYRMQQLGITDADNKISLWAGDGKTKYDFPVFEKHNKGIKILVYTIDRHKVFYKKHSSKNVDLNERGWNTNNDDRWSVEYSVIRLEVPFEKKDGSIMKYEMPKGEATLPFFPPALVAKYDKKTEIEALYLTEGYFKAFKASLHGIDCVGLPSITCLKDRETGELHGDVLKLIIACNVKRLVWLTDGDCRNISGKEINAGIDLYKRPNQFFRSIATFYDLTSKLDNVFKYFAHIDTVNIEGEPKGLDDLLIAFPEDAKAIAKELNSFNVKKEQLNYIVRFEITYGIGKIHRYFHLHDVDAFYLYHVEKRPELANYEFKFNGTLYQYDTNDNKCKVKIPSSAANYFRVGDDYYEFVEIPDKYGNLTKQQHKRRKETIKDDNGKDIFNHIPKYRAFCNVPEHLNYQRIIHNCFNTYHPFAHEPEEGTCEATIEFIKHVFGEDEITVDDFTIKRYELALDYLTILYKHPQQILPILCLVSKERQTGKTTFLKWLKLIFTENLAIVSNQDFENNFNSHWATKLIIGCDETKIEKHIVMEKIKGLSTASSIMKEGKGVDQVSMDFFGKFILLSNNEDNFASIDAEEIRFWIIKVPVIKGRNVNLLDDLLDEIPAFLHFLSQRKILTKHVERHWFDTRLLRTSALQKIIDNSKPKIQQLIHLSLADLFNATEYKTICMRLDDVQKELLNGKYDKGYVKQTLHEMGYKTVDAGRKSFPRLKENSTQTGIEITAVDISFHGRYYEFKRADFTDKPLSNGVVGTEDKNDDEEDLPF